MRLHQLTDVGRSNYYTMGLVATIDPRRSIPDVYKLPDLETRRLRARLILEEALETIQALGFDISVGDTGVAPPTVDVTPNVANALDLTKIIDGCCDTIYVATGTLLACGAPDRPHLAEVCDANDRKFPDGKPVVNANGKFQKPEGWVPPDHQRVMQEVTR